MIKKQVNPVCHSRESGKPFSDKCLKKPMDTRFRGYDSVGDSAV
jgi:hypothetical protein